MRKLLLWGLAALCLPFMTVTALAQTPGYTTTGVHLRAGPGTNYPSVAVVPANSAIKIYGCQSGYDWCDTKWGAARGWIDSQYIVTVDNGQKTQLTPAVATAVGIGLATFSQAYWNSYYVGYPWYNQWAHYYHPYGPYGPHHPYGPPPPYHPYGPYGPHHPYGPYGPHHPYGPPPPHHSGYGPHGGPPPGVPAHYGGGGMPGGMPGGFGGGMPHGGFGGGMPHGGFGGGMPGGFGGGMPGGFGGGGFGGGHMGGGFGGHR
ncbi:SH3 domain-containing protein [Hoeflea sp. WL0058]|uniref:SH3 domain-containing protein n=1 Tax=Flavimaribacter sediminis TaxID=2865987 RepID=A0AAE2ZP96_9HYPH|nr:SH3 domain-containing protein [Flavimaribacter sediminis]MBW8640504.1 SH3 domain-containing protein [Flavimaribacter sediminis]